MNWFLTGRVPKCSRFANVCKPCSSHFCKNVSSTSPNEFVPVYKFPYIRAAGLLNRLKFYQAAATAVSVPASVVLYNAGFVNVDTLTAVWTIGKLRAQGFSTIIHILRFQDDFVGIVFYKSHR